MNSGLFYHGRTVAKAAADEEVDVVGATDRSGQLTSMAALHGQVAMIVLAR